MAKKKVMIELPEADTVRGIKRLQRAAYISFGENWYLIDPADADAIEKALTDGFEESAEISLELAICRNGEGTGVSHEFSMRDIVSKLIGKKVG